MIGCCNKGNEWVHSPFKTVLGKIRNRYQSYCAIYKTHAMTTCHGGVGHAGEDRYLNSHVEDARNIDVNAQKLQLLSEDQRQMATSVTS